MAEWSENPFASGGAKPAAAPFDDPSITQASAAVPEYNPFEGAGASSAAKDSAATPAASTTPDWANPSAAVTAAVTKPPAAEPKAPTWAEKAPEPSFDDQNIDEESLVRTPKGDRDKNWPPFPEDCRWPFKACFHHDFKGEIPEWGYLALKNVYRSWVFYSVNLLFNCICAWAALDVKKCSEGTGKADPANIGKSAWLAPLLMLIFIPCSYCCWFQPLYQAMRKDSSLRFGWFFLTFFLQVISTVMFATGFFPPAAGFINAAKIEKGCNAWSDKNPDDPQSATIISILWYINGSMWITLALYQFFLLQKTLRLFRSTGGSLEKMQSEAVVGAATSDIGKQAGKAALSNAMSNA